MGVEADEHEFWRQAKDSYLRTWTNGLGALLQWSEAATLEWAKQWSDSLDHRIRVFYHTAPEQWMAYALIPPQLRERFLSRRGGGLDLKRLVWRLTEAIQDSTPNKDVVEYDAGDWEKAKASVEAILSEYGEGLPRETKRGT